MENWNHKVRSYRWTDSWGCPMFRVRSSSIVVMACVSKVRVNTILRKIIVTRVVAVIPIKSWVIAGTARRRIVLRRVTICKLWVPKEIMIVVMRVISLQGYAGYGSVGRDSRNHTKTAWRGSPCLSRNTTFGNSPSFWLQPLYCCEWFGMLFLLIFDWRERSMRVTLIIWRVRGYLQRNSRYITLVLSLVFVIVIDWSGVGSRTC